MSDFTNLDPDMVRKALERSEADLKEFAKNIDNLKEYYKIKIVNKDIIECASLMQLTKYNVEDLKSNFKNEELILELCNKSSKKLNMEHVKIDEDIFNGVDGAKCFLLIQFAMRNDLSKDGEAVIGESLHMAIPEIVSDIKKRSD